MTWSPYRSPSTTAFSSRQMEEALSIVVRLHHRERYSRLGENHECEGGPRPPRRPRDAQPRLVAPRPPICVVPILHRGPRRPAPPRILGGLTWKIPRKYPPNFDGSNLVGSNRPVENNPPIVAPRIWGPNTPREHPPTDPRPGGPASAPSGLRLVRHPRNGQASDSQLILERAESAHRLRVPVSTMILVCSQGSGRAGS